MVKNRALRVFAGVVVAILVLAVGSASAAAITVDDSGGADYLSIQSAINNASAGDMIYVNSGTYYENVVVNKTLSLVGIGMPLINASGSGTAMTITTDDCTIDGFNVTGSGTEWNGGDADSGIKIKSENNTVLNCTVGFNNYGIYVLESEMNSIRSNSVYSSTEGIYAFYSSNNSVMDNTISTNSNRGILISNSNNCTISNNTASGNTDGIYLTTSTNCSISDNTADSNSNNGIYLYSYSTGNTLTNNTASGNGYGIYLYYSGSNTLTNNTASGNRYGIYLRASDSNTLTNNTASSNGDGIYLYHSGGNTLTNNTASSNTRYGLYLYYSSSSNTIIKNTALNNSYGFYIGDSSSSNMLLKNNLIDSINYNAYDIAGSNSWIYNHYSDYTGSDADNNGIGDTAYYIAGGAGAKDMLPAMQPWNMSEIDGDGASFTLNTGETITLYEGYSLTPQQIDVDGTKAWIKFEKDGTFIEDGIINSGESFSYVRTIDGTDHIIFQGVLDTVFQGQVNSLIKITYFYQFSEINGRVLIEKS
jgi:parallel beta-helix repeat protein